MSRIGFIFCIFCLFLASCEQSKKDESKKPGIIKREGEPDVYNIDRTNETMNAAMEKARSTLHVFKEALLNPKYGCSNYSLKVRFANDDIGEHLWLSGITHKDGSYTGLVNNDPEYITNIKHGDIIDINQNDISDWMYMEGSTLRGGFTIRAIYNDLSEKEKDKFLLENGIMIDEKEF